MKRLGLLLLALVSVFASGLRAGELIPGLAYLRPGTEIVAQTGSVVVDLRYATDDEAAAPILAALEAGKTNPRRIVLVLVSPETSSGLRRQLVGQPRCLTIGRVAPDFKTDITVTTPSETDRRAFDALVAGTPPGKLIVENAEKTRYDETALIRDYVNGTPPVHPSESLPAEPNKPVEPSKPAEQPLVDVVLQTATHIYQGLFVLKKL
jgi:hypothetical protein